MEAYNYTYTFPLSQKALITKMGVSYPYDPKIKDLFPLLPFPIHETEAMWDTGAFSTVIAKPLAQKAGLIANGQTKLKSVVSETPQNNYVANVYFPNKLCIANLNIFDLDWMPYNVGLLIGMDIIGLGDLNVYSDGEKIIMMFTLPSIEGRVFLHG